MTNNRIKWWENAAFDAPELNSPQPCIHGAGCVFTIKDSEGKVTPGCCRYVHPGEEGTGRRYFAARTLPDGREQPACVRLTGAADAFYERRGRKIPWQEWCKQKGIPFVPNKPGEKHEPVKRVPFKSNHNLAQPKTSSPYSYLQLTESELRTQLSTMSYKEPVFYGNEVRESEWDIEMGYNEEPEFYVGSLTPLRIKSFMESESHPVFPLRIRGHRRSDEDEGTGHTPEAFEKTNENIDFEALD